MVSQDANALFAKLDTILGKYRSLDVEDISREQIDKTIAEIKSLRAECDEETQKTVDSLLALFEGILNK